MRVARTKRLHPNPLRRIRLHPFVGVDLPATLREIATAALGVAHADLRLRAVGGPRLESRAGTANLLRHGLGIMHEKPAMRDAEGGFVAFLVIVEGLDRHIGMAIANMFVAIARLLA